MARTLLLPIAILAVAGCSSAREHAPPLAESTDSGAGASFGTGGRTSRGGGGGKGSVEDGGSDADAGATGGGGGAPPGPCPAKVLTGDARVLSKADLVGFQGYTDITGALYIGTNITTPVNDVSSLSVLHCLETVGGEVTILETPNLKTLQGLENLSSATSLKITTMAGLESLDGLTALALDDTLLIRNSPVLTRLGGIASAVTVVIDGNASLTQCAIDSLMSQLGSATCTCSGIGGPCP